MNTAFNKENFPPPILTVNAESNRLTSFASVLSTIAPDLKASNEAAKQATAETMAAQDFTLDKRWLSLPVDSPEISAILNNDTSVTLIELLETCPLAEEIILADDHGRLVAATQKTSDFIQSDESWWRQGMALKHNEVWYNRIEFDDSAGVFSLDVVLPVYQDKTHAPAGVLKAVFNISELLHHARSRSRTIDESVDIDVILPNGAIVARINTPDYEAFSEKLSEPTLQELVNASNQAGWFIMNSNDATRLVGVHKAPFAGANTQTIFVTYSTPYDTALVPIKTQLSWILGLITLAIIILLAGALWYTQRYILNPISNLSNCAQLISGSTEAHDSPVQGKARTDAMFAIRQLRELKAKDELESFADTFATMADKVIRYHRELETEVAEKTAAIRKDLKIAREFQTAMMQTEYPNVPKKGSNDPLTCQFWHVYQPSEIIGGDFFNIFRISEHKAGIFVADVMGHGARSALVTAILRALLPSITGTTKDPSSFLKLLNSQFCEIIERSDQSIFVTALFMVIDTQDRTLTYSSGGHPLPIIANRTQGVIDQAATNRSEGPALGLFENASFTTHEKELSSGDLFFLYTDGITEAEAPNTEMFGIDNLMSSINQSLTLKLQDICNNITEDLQRFSQHNKPQDDICLVAVEILPTEP